jgi:hypothetical protein
MDKNMVDNNRQEWKTIDKNGQKWKMDEKDKNTSKLILLILNAK